MKSSDVTYGLAVGQAGLDECHNAACYWNYLDPDQPIGHPCVIARKDGHLIGFISTVPLELMDPPRVTLNRLIFDPGLKPFRKGMIGIRMLQLYEKVLKQAGVKWYYIHFYSWNVALINQIVKLLGTEPYYRDFEATWIKRYLTGEMEQSNGR